MVVPTILTPGTQIQSPDNTFNVASYEGGMYDLESNGKSFFIDADAVNYLVDMRIWEVKPCD